jgi:thioredoxin-related protein
MKKLLFFFLLVLSIISVTAQDSIDTIPPYKKDPKIPAFKIALTDGTWFTNEQLPKNKYTLIVYFSPDCEHCKHEIKEVIKNINELKDVNMVWASYKSLSEIKEFYTKFELSKYPNIFIGRDREYQLPSFFRVKFTPFVALYNKQGLFVQAFEQGSEMSILLPLLK